MSALGQKQTCAAQQFMSALPPIADICRAQAYVRFVPIADMCSATRNVRFTPESGISRVTRMSALSEPD